ncbi:MAG TPA: Spy/CpxP family protein refolding chaperone [Burkholderiaceae bacterium]|nr:Spy/CpxP family protein refolding chaperone [Burkholderiaceae bacterium]
MVTAGVVLALASSFALVAMARPGPGGPGGPGEMGGEFGFVAAPHLLDSVNATEAQKAQIKQIMQAARADMRAQRTAGASLHEQAVQLFMQPTVDAAAVESLRQQMLQQHDQSSRRFSQAMIEVSRVLTPEQRAQLGAQMKKRHEMMQRHMNERRSLEGAPPSN